MFHETRNCTSMAFSPADERYSDIISLAHIFTDHNADPASSVADPDPSAEESVSECLALPQESVSESLSLAEEVVSEPIHLADDCVFEAVRFGSSDVDLAMQLTDAEEADGGDGSEDADNTILRKVNHIQFTATVDLTVSGFASGRYFFAVFFRS